MHTPLTAIDITMRFVRACGPVGADEISAELRAQCRGVDSMAKADAESGRAIRHGLEAGWLKLYDGNPGEYVLNTR